MDQLKGQRKICKAHITRAETWLNKYKDSAELSEFELRCQHLTKAFDNYCSIQDQIELLDEDEVSDREIVETNYFKISSIFVHYQKMLSAKGTQANNVSANQFASFIKLPDLKIPQFSGDITEWRHFYELFEKTISQNQQLSGAEKLTYLKAFLKGEPLNLINNLKIEDGSFQIAIDTLKNRFDNQLKTIYAHIKNIIEAPSLSKTTCLRNFITIIKQNIDALNNLDAYDVDLVFIYILTQKLDSGTVKAFEYERRPDENPTVKTFLEFLEKRCRVLETIPESNTTQKKQFSKISHQVNITQISNPEFSKFSEKKCLYCSFSNHTIYHCNKYNNLSHSDKRNFIKNNSLCFICLRNNHKTAECQSKGCFICKGRHHSSLHLQTESLQENKNSSQPPRKNDYKAQYSSQNKVFSNQGFSDSPNTSYDAVNQNNRSVNQTPSYRSNHNQIQSNSDHNQTSEASNSQSKNSDNQVVLSTLTASGTALLATAEISLYSKDQNLIHARAVLDPCSTTSLITNSLNQKLKYKTSPANITIGGIENMFSTSNNMVNNVTIHSNVNHFKFNVNFTVVNKITKKLPQVTLKREKILIPNGIKLADPKFHVPSDIDILLGADVYYDLITGEFLKIQGNFLTLLETHLGYIVGGSIPSQVISLHTNMDNNNSEKFHDNTCLFLDSSDDHFLQKFWCIEEMPSITNILSPDDEQAEIIFQKTIKVLDNGSYQVDLPLKNSNENAKLGNSYFLAEKRFLNLEKRLEKDHNLFERYKGFIDEYIDLNHGQYVPLSLTNEKGENKYFLPHHCIIRESSQSTKLRVVFDAGAKSSSGYSLNDIMLKGYTVQSDLFNILNRFRLTQFVLIADIEKMYRQIRINPKQLFLQNILWRENSTKPLQCIQLQTVTYGTNSAPFLATRTLKELATNNQENFPLAAEAVLKQTYVDDILGTANSLNELKELQSQLINLFNLGNFKLHKWASNSKELLNSILNQKTQDNYDIKIENVSNKVLGISWNSEYDYFSVTLPQNCDNILYTKREVLSKIAQMFDPLGLIGPVIVIAKIFMQKIWISKLDWDDQLNNEMSIEWDQFMKNILKLSSLKIPRYLFSQKQAVNIQIHGFSDASLKAYGACIYIRAIYCDQTVSCNLVTSKSRVSPISTVSLPRLELCAAVLLSKLIQTIISIFENKISITSVNLWTDSEITLCWIKAHPSRWTTFVSNRVAEIQRLTSQFSWRHISSAQNPADCLSRGLNPAEIHTSDLWWHGPQILMDPNLNLESYDTNLKINEIPEEKSIPKKKETILHISDKHERSFHEVFSNFSSFTRLQRTIAFCHRFINNSIPNLKKFQGPLSVTELQKSEITIIKILQNHHFAQEIEELKSNKIISNKSVLHLAPFLDESGILRVGGRLSSSDLSFNQKHQILLPSKNYVVALMLKKEHITLGHAGAHTVLSNFKLKFWPLNGLREIKRIIGKCITCYRFKAITCQQFMSDLPKDRVKISRPFSKVGVDFGGPFFIRSSKLRKAPILKSYIAVFVCMTTKAVHIELVSDLSTEAFLLTLKRFIARRGNPQIIYSDNATNFLGSRNQLKELRDFFRSKNNLENIENFLTSTHIQWKFIPPKSPHWGGLWESAIKSTKFHILRIVGETHLTFEEFSTVLAQIEAILNSRPLLPLSNDPSDFSVLTPGHFLIGNSLTSYPEPDLTETTETKLSRWQLCTKMQQNFWRRWSKEYLNLLQNRPKWLMPFENLKLNDLVLLKEDNIRPLEWPLARVLEILPSRDNKIRVVKIKTKNGIFTRNITKLCPLPNTSETLCPI